MSFDVGAVEYDRFMGRYSVRLAPLFADFAGVRPGDVVLDVGCGPGALTGELVRRLGASSVVAVDPSESFVAAVVDRNPGIKAQKAVAEELPYTDRQFHAALGQLVVHYLTDPGAGLGEMARVTKIQGTVAACVWDFAGGRDPLSDFWKAAHELDADVEDQSRLAGARQGQLAELLADAGLGEIEEALLTVEVEHPSFEEWWEPFTLGVGAAGTYAGRLAPRHRDRLRDSLREMLPPGPFTVVACAWAARGQVG